MFSPGPFLVSTREDDRMVWKRLGGALGALLVVASTVRGAEPKAVLKGPQVWYQDWPLVLRFAGTVSDDPVKLYLAKAPEPIADVDVVMTLGRNKRPVFAQVVPGARGYYRFVLVASGTPEGDPEGERVEVATTLDVYVIRWGERVPNPLPPPDPAPPGPIPPPGPTPPIPHPDVDPPPPDPGPTPDPAPVPDGPTRVLLLYESEDPMTRKQRALWDSIWLMNYLESSTAPDSLGESGWRKFDDDTAIVKQAPEWLGMMTVARDLLAKPGAPKLPAIAVFRGTHGKLYPFPEDEATVEKLVKGVQ